MNDLPTETTCGSCFACVPLDSREWVLEDEGASQVCHCPKCGYVVFAIFGTEAFVQECAIDAQLCVSIYRERMLH